MNDIELINYLTDLDVGSNTVKLRLEESEIKADIYCPDRGDIDSALITTIINTTGRNFVIYPGMSFMYLIFTRTDKGHPKKEK